MIFKKKKELNKINLLENVKVMKTNELMFVRNIIVHELRKRGLKHV